MKACKYFLLMSAFLFGCSKSPDSTNGGSGGGGGSNADTQAPSIPTNISGIPTSNSIQLNWNLSTDNIAVSGYNVFRNGNMVGSPQTNSYIDNGLSSNTTYSYSVAAYDAANNNSAQSNAYTITTIQADTTSLITGRWGVIKDSVSNVGNFYFIQGGTPYYPNGGIYFGVPADYWDFNTNGNLAIRENNNTYNNIPYHLLGNARVFITDLSSAYNDAVILLLNTTNATLFWTKTAPNGGVYTRKLYLRK